MSFREDLEQICTRVEGAVAASLMGFDGIPIETIEPKPTEGVELATLFTEYSGILSQVKQAAETLQMGHASEVSIRTEKLVAVARLLTPEYFVVVAMEQGLVGRCALRRRKWRRSWCRTRLTAYGLRLTAYGLRLTAYAGGEAPSPPLLHLSWPRTVHPDRAYPWGHGGGAPA
jgi:predicted regulator of Ras-like GTPase activity (Roadblock/LC7/MglB family)